MVRNKKRITQNKRQKITDIQDSKKDFPALYSFRCFKHQGLKYMRFPDNLIYPIDVVEKFVEWSKKARLTTRELHTGLILEIPAGLGKMIKKGTIRGTITKTTKKDLRKLKKRNQKSKGKAGKKKVNKPKKISKKVKPKKRVKNAKQKLHKRKR